MQQKQTTKVISPIALNTLKEALTNIYWFKSELRSFLHHTISDPAILNRLNWEDYKRNIAHSLIDHFAKDQSTFQGDLLKLITEICKINDYSHLSKLEDGKKKASDAKESVEALRKIAIVHIDIIEEQKKSEQRRQEKFEELLKKQGVNIKLETLNKELISLVQESNAQARGYKLEKLLNELFALFDLDPKASFRITGEQIDGAFTFENTDFLFEAKWQTSLISIQDLDAFSGKLSRRLENTLGLFLSINGFSEDAVRAHSTGRRMLILMDGSDLMAVLEGRIDLIHLLYRKRRYASQTGNIYLRSHEILG